MARQFYTRLEDLDPDVAFQLAVKEKDYAYAIDIHTRLAPSIQFKPVALRTLAKYCMEAGETEYEQGKVHRNKKEWLRAESRYLKSYELKKIAFLLWPSDEAKHDVQVHKRLYAQLIIDADQDLYLPEASNLAAIQKAIILLKECKPVGENEVNYHQHALGNALMRRVDTLREKVALDYGTEEFSIVKPHRERHFSEIKVLIKTLEEIIELLKGTKEKGLLLKLGKAHYLLADLHDYFDINSPDINYHYRAAMESVPNNPFYVLRISESYPEEVDALRERGITRLKALGFTTLDFYHWSPERWTKRDKIIYPIKDIHADVNAIDFPSMKKVLATAV